jgi:hypothetical protein
MKHYTLGIISIAAACAMGSETDPVAKAEVLEVRKIWDKAPHNAFTDLIRFQNRWYLAFREGSAHVSPDGAVRILSSADGERWSDAGRLAVEGADLRDPKLTVAPNQILILNATAAFPASSQVRHQSYVFYTSDGRDWSRPTAFGDCNFWMWRISWNRDRAYSLGYSTVKPHTLRLYSSPNGIQWSPFVDELLTGDFPNESAMLFTDDQMGYCLLRRDEGTKTALLGSSRPPHRGWEWKDLGMRLGGPQMIRVPDGRVVVGARFYNGGERTSLAWLDLKEARLTEFLKLPSGGDNSYPGMVYRDGTLWVSYYSSHEGKAAIYLAKVKLPECFVKRPNGWMPPSKY